MVTVTYLIQLIMVRVDYLTQRRPVRSLRRKPEHDQRQASQEHTGQGEQICRKHHLPVDIHFEHDHGVVRVFVFRGQYGVVGSHVQDVPRTGVPLLVVVCGDIDPCRHRHV